MFKIVRKLSTKSLFKASAMELLDAGIPSSVVLRLSEAEKEIQIARKEIQAQNAIHIAQKKTQEGETEIQRKVAEKEAQRADFAEANFRRAQLDLLFAEGKLISRRILGYIFLIRTIC